MMRKPKANLFLVLFVSMLSIYFITTLASGFNYSLSPVVHDAGVNQSFNFTITATTGSGNISMVNITLPEGFTLNAGGNGTSVAAGNSFFSAAGSILIWNSTVDSGFVNTTEYFWVYASSDKNSNGTYNFNISVRGLSGGINSTNTSITVYKTRWSSPLGRYYVKPPTILLNHSNGYSSNVSLFINSTVNTTVNITVMNGTYYFSSNYSQSQTFTECGANYKLKVITSDGAYSSVLGEFNPGGYTNFTVLGNSSTFDQERCCPGRYRIEQLPISDANNSNVFANVSVVLDIPISAKNSAQLNVTGIGSFAGTIPKNATAYHSYYFNTSELANATGVTINASGWASTQDIDIFLFNAAGALKAKSINKSYATESLTYNYLPKFEMWEIRVFGNSTSDIAYRGNLMFTTLNMTDTSDSTISMVDFGKANTTGNMSMEYKLQNSGSVEYASVLQTVKLANVKRFSGSTGGNFTFLVPDSTIAESVKIVLNWTGAGNFSFRLYDQSNSLLTTSAEKHLFSNVTGAVHEEYNSTSVTGSSFSRWRVEVRNTTNSTSVYNITVYTYMYPSSWVATNFSTRNIQNITQNGSSVYLHMNLSVPSRAIDGLYEGELKYYDANSAGISVPFVFNVTTPMLVVNDTMNSMSVRVDDNYLKRGKRNITLNLTNPGSYDLEVNFTNSSLVCSGSCSNFYPILNYSYSNLIPGGSSQLVYINLTFNETLPVGEYSGLVRISSSNPTSNFTSHPYANFTLSITLNMTNVLEIRDLHMVTGSTYGQDQVINSSLNDNVTAKFKIYYLNGTEVEDAMKNGVNLTNFAAWMTETNVTNYRIPGGLGRNGEFNLSYATGASVYQSAWGYFALNFTVPSGEAGGRYALHVKANYTNATNAIYEMPDTTNSSLLLNNSGLYMSTNTTPCSFGTTGCTASNSMTNASTYNFYVNVSNFGPMAASSPTISFTESCSGYSASSPTYVNCPSTYFAPAGFNTSCLVYWTITSADGSYDACTATIDGGVSSKWFKTNGANITITVTKATTTSTPAAPGAGPAATSPTYSYTLAFTSAPTLVSLKQNTTASVDVQVKNTGNTSQAVTFTISGIGSGWWSSNSTLASLGVGGLAGFRVTFAVGNVDIKDYAGKFKVTGTQQNATSDFTLRVTPSNTSESGISANVTIYRSEIVQLGASINASKAVGLNVSAAEDAYDILFSNLQKAEAYVVAGDYFSAYQLFETIKTQIEGVKNELENATTAHQAAALNIKIIVAVAIAIAVAAAILAYLFWPTKSTFEPGRGYIQREGGEKVISRSNVGNAAYAIKYKLSELVQKIKSKFSRPKQETNYGTQ